MSQARIFFNDATGGSLRDDPASRQRLSEYETRSARNERTDHIPMWDGYNAENAVLVESMLSPMEVVDDNPIAVCDWIYGYLNMDERPNGRHERSLSVGDVIEYQGKRYACENMGWREV